MPPPPPPALGAVMVIPLLFPKSKLFDAVGDPVKVTSRNPANEAVELAAAAMVAVAPGTVEPIAICALELPAQLKALEIVTVWVEANEKKFGAVIFNDAKVFAPLMAHTPMPEDAPNVTAP